MRKSNQIFTTFLSKFGPLVALFLVYGFFVLLNPRITSLTAIETLVQQTVIVGISAIGMTLVIISGGIDLSAGSVIAMGSVAVAWAMQSLGLPPGLAACLGILAGLGCGFLNGVLITRLRMVPFIVTLGTLLVVRGFAKGLAGSKPINVSQTWLNDILAALEPGQKWMLIPPGGWLMILLAILVSGMIKYTRIGRHIVAVGSNEHTARLCGVGVHRTRIFVYSCAGAFSGLAGLMMMSYQEQGDPTGAIGLELDVIAAVVIGGGSLSGGEGSVIGSLIGAMIMTIIRTGCQLNGWPTWFTQVVTGVVIVLAVVIDRLRHRQEGLL